MNITENNKIIAEFMGLRKVICVRNENGKYFDYQLNDKFILIKEEEIQIESNNGICLVSKDYIFAEDLIFHLDWNWLMEVVEKIESLGFFFEIKRNWVKITKKREIRVIRWEQDKNKIEATYNACVEFIKWYNQQKQ